jgi:hypothetical protein
MIHNSNLLKETSIELRKVVEDFHYSLGSYYDITIISSDNSKISGTSFAELNENGDAVILAVNRFGYKYRENRDISDVISLISELNEGLTIIKKPSTNYDFFVITFEEIDPKEELNKPKKNLIKRRTKKAIESNETSSEPIKINSDSDTNETENPTL